MLKDIIEERQKKAKEKFPIDGFYGYATVFHDDLDYFVAQTAQIVAREVLGSMKTVATTRTHKLKIGQNEYARKQLNLTEKQIDDHNDYCEAWEEGYADAKKDVLTHLQSLEKELLDKK